MDRALPLLRHVGRMGFNCSAALPLYTEKSTNVWPAAYQRDGARRGRAAMYDGQVALLVQVVEDAANDGMMVG